MHHGVWLSINENESLPRSTLYGRPPPSDKHQPNIMPEIEKKKERLVWANFSRFVLTAHVRTLPICARAHMRSKTKRAFRLKSIDSGQWQTGSSSRQQQLSHNCNYHCILPLSSIKILDNPGLLIYLYGRHTINYSNQIIHSTQHKLKPWVADIIT